MQRSQRRGDTLETKNQVDDGEPDDIGQVRQFGRRLYDISDRLSLDAVTDRDPSKWEWFAGSVNTATSFREISGLVTWLGRALSPAVRKDDFDDWLALTTRASSRSDLEKIMQRAEKSHGNVIDWRLVKFQWQNPGKQPAPAKQPAAAKATGKRSGTSSPAPPPSSGRRKQKAPQAAGLDVPVPPKPEGRAGRARKPNPKYMEEEDPEPPRAKKPRVQGAGKKPGKKPRVEDAANMLLMVMEREQEGQDGEARVAPRGVLEPVDLSEGALAAAGMRWHCRRAVDGEQASTSGTSLAEKAEAGEAGRPGRAGSRSGQQGGGGQLNPKGFLCSSCRSSVQVRGGLIPEFRCSRCPAHGGRPRHAARAFAEYDGAPDGAPDTGEGASLWGAEEALEVVLQRIKAAVAGNSEGAAEGNGKGGAAAVRLQLQLPPAASREVSEELARGAVQAIERQAMLEPPGSRPAVEEEIGGRCKCGKLVTQSHPPCKSELMLLCDKIRRRYGDNEGKAGGGGAAVAPGEGEEALGTAGGEMDAGGDASGADGANGGAAEAAVARSRGAGGSGSTIQLNEAAVELGVARRRLYDVINVLEPVEVVVRTGKFSYEWRGTRQLQPVLERLLMDVSLDLPEGATEIGEVGVGAEDGSEEGDAAASAGAGRSQSQSLWRLSRKFVRLLIMQPGPIQLAAAALALVEGEGSRGGPDVKKSQALLTVERRLYDIGSILSSIGLIEKTYVSKAPAFSWSGFSHLPPPGGSGDDGGQPEGAGP